MEIRKSAPAVNNKYYVKTTYGGYNKCMLINEGTGSVIPNCVGYAYGRFMECANIQTCNLPTTNAKEWYKTAPYSKGQQPKQGAIACWEGNYGHVAFVEEVYANGSILTTQSNYDGERWESKILYPPYDKIGLRFQGFIYNPYLEDAQSNVKMYGCDVSEYQNPNTTDVSKYDYVIVRACAGTTHKDKWADEWIAKLTQLGKPFGVYCYSYALDDEGAISEADYIYNLLKEWYFQLGSVCKMGVWFDMEPDNYKRQHNFMSPEQWTSACNAFCQRMQDYGFYTGIYASQSYFDSHIKTTKWDRWVANWGNNDGGIHVDTSYLGTMLQYTSNGGKFDEDLTYCDLEHYKSQPAFMQPSGEDQGKDEQKPADEQQGAEILPPPMPDDDYLFKMKNTTYDFLKFMTHIIPIMTTFYIALANIWKWPLTDSIVATITAFDSMLIAIMNMSTIGYNNKGKK